MRILEKCSSAFPVPEIQAQIDALRVAFSADVNRPFELRPSFPYGSPSESHKSSPPLDSQYQSLFHQTPNTVQNRLGYNMHPITPPISAGPEDSKPDPLQLQSLGMVPAHPVSSHPMDMPLVDENSWDPTSIIQYEPHSGILNSANASSQFDMAFPMASSNASTSPPMAMSQPAPGLASSLPPQYSIPYDSASRMPSVPAPQPISQPQFNGQHVLFTPRDWQHSVASVYDPHGLKRRWAPSVDLGGDNAQKRQR